MLQVPYSMTLGGTLYAAACAVLVTQLLQARKRRSRRSVAHTSVACLPTWQYAAALALAVVASGLTAPESVLQLLGRLGQGRQAGCPSWGAVFTFASETSARFFAAGSIHLSRAQTSMTPPSNLCALLALGSVACMNSYHVFILRGCAGLCRLDRAYFWRAASVVLQLLLGGLYTYTAPGNEAGGGEGPKGKAAANGDDTKATEPLLKGVVVYDGQPASTKVPVPEDQPQENVPGLNGSPLPTKDSTHAANQEAHCGGNGVAEPRLVVLRPFTFLRANRHSQDGLSFAEINQRLLSMASKQQPCAAQHQLRRRSGVLVLSTVKPHNRFNSH